ncbi:ATP-binding protein [Methylobacterium sp. NEAU K]|uniref:ATP-binding protein n=1 Tax=Methylobacterium sp. NEAU K TaxID=3064946 RepID=UPI00273280A4|nr:ATP-binding protein [Methylobacterium sp. NEAU K]MDP4004559.1 ATP-binding protein [Methylobacterium sp. NEAU K]
MRSPVPRSLGGRLGLLLVLAVVAAQAAAFAMFAQETTRVGRAAGRTQVIDRVATLARLIDRVPPEAVPGVIAAYGSPRRHFSIGADSTVEAAAMDPDETRLAAILERRMRIDPGSARLKLVERDLGEDPDEAPRRAPPEALRVSVRLADGRWLNGEAPVFLPTPPWLRIGLAQLAASVAAVLVVVGFGLRGVVGPVSALAAAAQQVGRGAAVEPLPERGPRELARMSAAFNLMQARLRAFVEDRTRMLAAISHDLRTPIASLWLRAEMVEDPELREPMVRTLAEMRRMVEATLTFARDDVVAQAPETFDLAGMARALVDDHRALGRNATLSAPAALPFHGRPVSLRRALDNLVENAIRYGGCARITVAQDRDVVRVQVEDDGPGVPTGRVESLFEPFTRLDDARSDETGGIGLGLAIARSAVRAHGGEIRLVNRPGGGLRAEIDLPGTPASSQAIPSMPIPSCSGPRSEAPGR